jgi:hypothetical protein
MEKQMISSKDILDKTGIKNIKTLTRWHQRGLIPKPFIRTHPSGRGKIAYWPDWVLDHCMRLVELQRQGYSLQAAALRLDAERIEQKIKYVQETPSITDALADKSVRIRDRDITLLDLFLATILADVKRLSSDSNLHETVLTKLRNKQAIDIALHNLRAGYNPILLIDDKELYITTDIMLGQIFYCDPEGAHPYLVVPLLPPLRKAFAAIGIPLPNEPVAWPAPKLWAKHGDTTMEYMYYPLAPDRFELLRETAQTITVSPTEPKDKGGKDE